MSWTSEFNRIQNINYNSISIGSAPEISNLYFESNELNIPSASNASNVPIESDYQNHSQDEEIINNINAPISTQNITTSQYNNISPYFDKIDEQMINIDIQYEKDHSLIPQLNYNPIPSILKSNAQEYDDIDQCGICFEEEFPIQGVLPCCKHIFCYDCIERWSLKSNTCPFCLKTFNSITKQTYQSKNSKNYEQFTPKILGKTHVKKPVPQVIQISTPSRTRSNITNRTALHQIVQNQEFTEYSIVHQPFSSWLRYSLIFFSLIHLVISLGLYLLYIIGIIFITILIGGHILKGNTQMIIAIYMIIGFFVCIGGLTEVSLSFQLLRSSVRKSTRQSVYNFFSLTASTIGWISIYFVISFLLLILSDYSLTSLIILAVFGLLITLKITISCFPCFIYLFSIKSN